MIINKNKNKKGFTLVELLAVLVILSVVALIVTPLVLGYVETVRIEASKRSATNYLRAVDNEIITERLTEKTKINGRCTVVDKGYLSCNGQIIKASIKGTKPSQGYIIFSENKIETSYLCINDKTIKNGNEVIGDCKDPETMKLNGKITLAETSGHFTYPETKTIEVIENISGGEISCISSDNSVSTCSVLRNKIKISSKENEGASEITIISKGNDEYREAKAVYYATTKKGTLSVTANGYTGVYDGEEHGISVSSPNTIIKYGLEKGIYDLTSSPMYKDAGEYTVYYEITRPGFNTVQGSKNIVITQAEGCILLESNSGTVEYDKTKEIKIKETISDGEITVSVSNSNIVSASIENNKLVITGKQSGSTIVTLVVNETKNYTSATAQYSVEVIKANNTLILSSSYGTYTYPNGGTFTITENKSGGSLSCESSDTKVATCSINGNTVTVTLGTTKGTATLTIKSTSTPNYNAGQAVYVVTTNAGTLSVNANGYSGVYDGKEHGITVTANSGSVIKYGISEGIYNSTESPKYTDVGTYTVYYQISLAGYTTVTGSKTVIIIKEAGSVIAPTPKTLTYNEEEQILINAGSSSTGTIEYKLDNGSYSENLPKAMSPGTYTVYYRVIGDNNHYDVEERSLKVTIAKATLQYTSSGYEGVYDGKKHSIEVTSLNGTIMYGTSSGIYNLEESPEYADVGEYTVYYKITRTGYVDVTGSEIVKITKADNTLKLSANSGSYTYPNGGTFKIEENKSGGTLSCSSNNKEVANCSISGDIVTVTLGTEKGVATLTIKSEANKNYNAGQAAFVATTKLGTLSVTANGYTGVYDGKEHGITVSANNGSLIKYGTSEGTYDLSNSPTYKDVGEYTVYYQISLSGYDTVTGSRKVIITKAEGVVSAPTAKTLTYNGTNQILIDAGSSTTGTIYYKVGENGSYSTTLPTGKDAGSYTVYYKVLGDLNHNSIEEQSFTVEIAKKAGSVTAPKPESLTYTGSVQTLISAGSSTTGTIQYKVGNNGTYSTNLPTATNAGTYTVYYRVIGNSNHTDVAEKSISVTIAKAANTVKLEPTSGTHTYPTTGTFKVTASSTGKLTCSSNNNAVATCSISGNTVTVTPGTTAGTATLTVKSEETDNYKEGQAAYVVTGKLGTLSVTATGYEKAYDGLAHGITVTANSGATIKYGTSEGTYNLTSSPTYKDVGTHTVYYQVTLTGYTTVTGARDVVITKANVTYTAPTKNTLTYNESAQELIKAGTVSGGTMEYSLDGTNYSATIPTGTTAGTYTVHYKVVGDSNHNDVASQSINVTISKLSKTLTLSASSGTHTYPTSGTIAVTNKNDGALSCTSTNTNIATCSVSGTTVTVKPGTTAGEATLTISTPSTTNYNSQSATYKATIKSGTLSVSASGYSGTYNGNAYGITVTANSGATIKYGTTSGTYDRTSSPTYSTAGTHTVYYQVSLAGYTTVTGNRTVSIAKAKNTVTLEETSGTLTYPTSKTINVTRTSDGPLSCKTSNSAVATCSVNNTNKTLTITPGTTAGSATITVISAATDNYNEGQAAYAVTGKSGALSVTATGYSGTYDGAYHGITVSANSGSTIKYGTSSGTYDRTSSPTYKDAGTYTVYYQVSLAGYTTSTGSKTVSISKASGSITTSPTAKTLTYTGNAQTLIDGGSGTGTMYYKLSTASSYSTSLPIATAAGTYTVQYYAGSSTNYNSTSVYTINVTIGYASGSISTHPSAKTLTYTGSAQTLITAGSSSTGSMRYKVGSNGTYSSSLPTATAVGTYTVYYYSSGDANHYSSSTYSIDVTISKASGSITTAPVGKSLTYTGSSQTLISAGSSSTGTMYYKLSTASSYSTSLPTASAVGTYTIQYYAGSSTNYNSTSVSTVTATISKASGKITTSPTAKTLTYTGSAQTLINAGSSSTGTMYYKLSTASSYSTSLPTATNAGTYTVYYYAGSSTNYNSTSTYSLTVTISKASGSYTTRPTGKTIAYTGSSLTLVNAGSTSTGTIYYKLGSSGTYSTSLPTASALGTYTIYYKIIGNSNYNDVAESTLTSYIKTNFAINAKVGDYVSMTPSLSSFTTSTSYTGYDSTQTIYPSELKLWRIIKINSNGTVEMVSEYVSSTAVYFKGKIGYKNFIGYLNVLASKYTNSSYTSGSRYMGYNGQTQYLTDTVNTVDSTSLTAPWTSETGDTTVESQGGGDWNWGSDVSILLYDLDIFFAKGVDTPSTNQTYWMAGRYYAYWGDVWGYHGMYVKTEGGHSAEPLYVFYENALHLGTNGHRLRPVVILKSGLNPSGSGTSSSPWKLN